MTTPTPAPAQTNGWTHDPTKTQTSQDGRRRRVWCFRDETVGAGSGNSAGNPVPNRSHRTRQWDVDPSDDDGLDPADGGYANLGRDAMRASVAAGVDTRNRIRQSVTWKLYAPWIGMLLFLGVAIYGYGEPKGWFGVSTNSAVSPKTNRSVDGANAAGGGTNNCRALLEKWRRADQRFNWTDDDAAAVDAAIRADGGRP